MPKAVEPVSRTRFLFDFLASPTRLLGDDKGQLVGLEVEETRLIPTDGDTKVKGTGILRVIDVDTVVFCIGDKVDESFGLPVKWNAFVKNPDPQFPLDGVSYEAFDPEAGKPIEGVFVAGWSREASSGLVGIARKDGERGAKAVLQYLQRQPASGDPSQVLSALQGRLQILGKPTITKEDIQRLEAVEAAEAERLMLEEFKFGTNDEMLAAMGFALQTP
jgi:ferredoxin--NADP+ reductase